MLKPAIEKVESEIRQEKAEALGRTGERLEQILVEIRRLRRKLVTLAEGRRVGTGGEHTIGAEILKALAKDAELCGRAREIRHQLVVQQEEAVGFRCHEEVDRHYPMPAPLTLARLIRMEFPR